jgi:predicted cobalt transporter CbtA
MAPSRADSDSGKGGVRKSGGDAVQLTIDYVKQETLEPLKGLGRFLAWGVAGSIAIAIGLLLLLIGILRLLQDETGTSLTGTWSWVPYFAVSVLGVAVLAVAAWRITAGPAQRKLPKPTTNGTKGATVQVDRGQPATIEEGIS